MTRLFLYFQVCLYLSSNGDDTELERSIFATSTIPELRQYCGEWNLDLSVIDLNSSSSELKPSNNSPKQLWFQINDDNAIPSLRLKVLRQCCEEGAGPSFLVSSVVADEYQPFD